MRSKDSIRDCMKVGIIHFMAYPAVSRGEGPVLDTLKKIVSDNYFDVVEITRIKDPETRDKVKKLLDAARVEVYYGAQPQLLVSGLNPNDPNKNGREKAVDLLKGCVDEACQAGAAGFAFLSGRYEEKDKEKAFNALVDSTKEVCAYAKTKGDLKVVLEVFDYDVDKKSLIGPAQLAKRYAKEIRKEYDNFGLLVDLSHLPLLKETPEEAILPVKDYLVHVHIGNCVTDPSLPGYGDQHPRFGFPGGANDVAELTRFLKVLLDIGFLNREKPPVVSFEVKPFGDDDPESVIAGAKRTLDKALAML